jgi:hypothetical protein
MSEIKTKQIVLFGSNEAAQFKTGISGWVSRNGNFYGKDERAARYDGCTHRPCKDCGAPTEKGWLVCEKCRAIRDAVRYNAMPKVVWGEVGMIYSSVADKYFSSWGEVEDYCEDEVTQIDKLRLVICKGQTLPLLSDDYGCDELAEDGELPDVVIEAIEKFNQVIKSVGMVSWYPDNKAVEYRESKVMGGK